MPWVRVERVRARQVVRADDEDDVSRGLDHDHARTVDIGEHVRASDELVVRPAHGQQRRQTVVVLRWGRR